MAVILKHFSVFSVKALLKEAKDQKAVMDKLNELSGSLLDLIPWHAREGLDKLINEDNERYQAVRDTVSQQVDHINADILKSQQVNQTLINSFILKRLSLFIFYFSFLLS